MVATNQIIPIRMPIHQSCAAPGPAFLRHVPLRIWRNPNQSSSEIVAPQNTGIQLARVEKTGLAPSFNASSPTRLVKAKPKLAQALRTPEAAHTSNAIPNLRVCPATPVWRSRIAPALPQMPTPTTHPAMPARITPPPGVRSSEGDFTTKGRMEPTAVLIPMIMAKPIDMPATTTPYPKRIEPMPQPNPKATPAQMVGAPAERTACGQLGNTI